MLTGEEGVWALVMFSFLIWTMITWGPHTVKSHPLHICVYIFLYEVRKVGLISFIIFPVWVSRGHNYRSLVRIKV